MQINVHAPHVKANKERIQEEVERVLDRFSDRITRVEVFLQDVNAGKGGNDKQCKIEARPRGLDPVAAEDLAAQPMEAVSRALGKLERLLNTRFGRLEGHR
ncbi:MAG: ribosome-associated translation inhibitor RaiA [Chlamydiales bacterium]|jgi:ribosome-associated translation inhibitor RaiA